MIEEKKSLKRKQEAAQRQQKLRDGKKQKMIDILEKYPELAAQLKICNKKRKPRIEYDQPDLLKVCL